MTWTIEGDSDAEFLGDGNDLLELVGNLADNATKWAASRIVVQAFIKEGRLHLKIEDDGPGVPEGTEAEVMVRGRRLDETSGGTGLGLAIVARIVEAYAGTIHLDKSSTGGLAVAITLPGRRATQRK